ncbi:dephospho-CoA kinase [bacterium A37T11]|nr:dephospho-CoA kinase [bacterium A37T11]
MKVGITGGIGSGKTTISRIFHVLGIPIFYADEAAKRIMQDDKDLVAAIKANFGNEAYDKHGLINRPYLAARVFANNDLLATLNALVHPATIRSAEEWSAKQSALYSLKEAALLFESNSYKLNDLNILIISPMDLRIKRIIQRDGISEKAVKARINRQWDDNEKLKLADFVIYNDEKRAVIPQVLAIHHKIISKTAP